MAESRRDPAIPEAGPEAQLEGGTYEIIRSRLLGHGKDLRGRLEQLNAARKEAFGSIESTLIGSHRVVTENKCVPRDMVAIGRRFIFGYNVFIGLRSETVLSDVFAVYGWDGKEFAPSALDLMADETFETDFKGLYKYYRQTTFAKFAVIGPHLFMVFRVGKSVTDVKTFKWLMTENGGLKYVGNRSDHEYVFPPQHGFEWQRVTHEMHRSGDIPTCPSRIECSSRPSAAI